MRRLRLGDLAIDIDLEPTGTDDLAAFLDLISELDATVDCSHRLTIRRRSAAHLVVDEHQRVITLTLPSVQPGTNVRATTEIGILQALARGVAFAERSAAGLALLHGSALTVTLDGYAVAVLDGGLGQGKTSLAIGLARRYGRLLVDEFTFARACPDGVILSAAPTLPWHVRADMAAYLAPHELSGPLLFADELGALATTTRRDAALRLILVPDRGIPAGRTEAVTPARARDLLHCAVTDHLYKLADPQLDHVSIFASAAQVTDPTGQPLAGRALVPPARETMLEMLAVIPTFRVGIGTPDDLPVSVAAASRLIEAMAP